MSDDIEVTQEMVDAGNAVAGFAHPEQVDAAEMYRAMEHARRADERFTRAIDSARRRYPDVEVLAWGRPGREQPELYPPLIIGVDCIETADAAAIERWLEFDEIPALRTKIAAQTPEQRAWTALEMILAARERQLAGLKDGRGVYGDRHPHGHEVIPAPLGRDAITLREFE